MTPLAASIAMRVTSCFVAGASEDTSRVSTEPFSMNMVTTEGTGRRSTPTNCTTLMDSRERAEQIEAVYKQNIKVSQ